MLENDLTNIEMLIMECIWSSPEELSLSLIVNEVNRRFDRDWKPQTISTYLAHLVRKNFLTMRRVGKVFLYTPVIQKADYCEKQRAELVKYWGEFGTAKDFLAAFAACTEENKELGSTADILDIL